MCDQGDIYNALLLVGSHMHLTTAFILLTSLAIVHKQMHILNIESLFAFLNLKELT